MGWLLPVLAVLVPLACSPGLGDAFELPKLFFLKLGLVLALLALLAGAAPDTAILRAPPVLATLLFLGASAASTLASVEPRTALLGNYGHDQGLLTLAILIGYFFLAAHRVRSEAALARLAAGLAVAASCAALYAAAQHLGLDPLGWPVQFDGRRASATFGHPNALGEFLAMTLPLTAWLAWRGSGLRRDLPLWGAGLQLVALLLTQARAAWLTVLLQMLVVGILLVWVRWGWPRLPGRPLLLVPQAVALLSFIVLLLVPSAAGQAEAAVSRVVARGEPLLTRHLLWQSALGMLADRPLLGWGPDTFQLVYPGYRSTELDARAGAVGRDDAVHNALLRVAVSSGLVGVVAYLAVLMAVLLLFLTRAFEPSDTGRGPIRPAFLALLAVWTSYSLLFVAGESRVTTEWLSWLVAGSAVGLAGVPASSSRRIVGVARLAPLLLAAGLLVEAGSALAADVAYGRGLDQRQQGSLGEAVAWLQRAVTLRPIEPAYRQDLALGLVALARQTNDPTIYRSAVDQLGVASALSGQRDAYVLVQLAHAQLDWEAASGGATDAALTFALRAVQLDPQNPLMYAEVADLAARQNFRDQARQYWETARGLSRSPDAHQRVGQVALQLGDWTSARQAFQRAALDEWRPPLKAARYRAWGQAALSVGAFDDAALAFREALAREPEDVTARLERAEALTASGKRVEALEEALRVLERSPDNPRARALVQQLSHE